MNTQLNTKSTTNLVSTAHSIRPSFSKMANNWREEEEVKKQVEAYRKAKSARERREILHEVMKFRRHHASHDDDYRDEDVHDELDEGAELNEKFPPHGRRGRYSPPDSEGWRLVTRYTHKQKRELTEAELAQKYRETFFENSDDGNDGDMNGDLTEKNQRREFY